MLMQATHEYADLIGTEMIEMVISTKHGDKNSVLVYDHSCDIEPIITFLSHKDGSFSYYSGLPAMCLLVPLYLADQLQLMRFVRWLMSILR